MAKSSAASVTNIANGKTKVKKPRAERGSLFSQKARYVGPTAKLTLHVRETQEHKFKVYVLIEKKGKDKKERGMPATLETKEKAIARFDEIAAECVAAGWKLQSTVQKSAFDVIPAAV